jgi:hypothetical protein
VAHVHDVFFGPRFTPQREFRFVEVQLRVVVKAKVNGIGEPEQIESLELHDGKRPLRIEEASRDAGINGSCR